jgi:hypothetical protein
MDSRRSPSQGRRPGGFVDSAGLGELVASYNLIAAVGRQMKLLRPGSRLDSLLHITKLYSTYLARVVQGRLQRKRGRESPAGCSEVLGRRRLRSKSLAAPTRCDTVS